MKRAIRDQRGWRRRGERDEADLVQDHDESHREMRLGARFDIQQDLTQ
jgi:hypothetical protein